MAAADPRVDAVRQEAGTGDAERYGGQDAGTTPASIGFHCGVLLGGPMPCGWPRRAREGGVRAFWPLFSHLSSDIRQSDTLGGWNFRVRHGPGLSGCCVAAAAFRWRFCLRRPVIWRQLTGGAMPVADRILRCVHGFVDDMFAPVGAAFEAGLTGGAELGASVCVIVEGQTVVDLWGGFADAARTRPWQRDAIVNVYSCTKTMTALTALLLADRGEIDLAAPVSRYWPRFAANGKDQITV